MLHGRLEEKIELKKKRKYRNRNETELLSVMLGLTDLLTSHPMPIGPQIATNGSRDVLRNASSYHLTEHNCNVMNTEIQSFCFVIKLCNRKKVNKPITNAQVEVFVINFTYNTGLTPLS